MMNAVSELDAYAAIPEPAALRLQRKLPGSVERVWSYLTRSDLRAQWLAAGEMTLKADAPFELVWRNDQLSDAPGARPEGFGPEHRMASRIVAIDPPRSLVFTWGDTGRVTFELEPVGEEALLTITHVRISDRHSQLQIAAGWHAHLDVLRAKLRGEPAAPFWDRWVTLKADYEQRIPA